MKLYRNIFLTAGLGLFSALGMSSCSQSGDESEHSSVFITEQDFVTGQRNYTLYGTTVFTFAPTGIDATPEETGGSTIAAGNLILADQSVPVNFIYETAGDADSPYAANLQVSFADQGDVTDATLLRALGFASTTRAVSITVDFNFLSATCNITVSGIQTRTVGVAEESIVSFLQAGKYYDVVAPSF